MPNLLRVHPVARLAGGRSIREGHDFLPTQGSLLLLVLGDDFRRPFSGNIGVLSRLDGLVLPRDPRIGLSFRTPLIDAIIADYDYANAVGLSQADAVISSWDNKYHFDFWRPVTAIREAESDGNAATESDAEWLPLIGTPNFPSYTAAHGTASGATSKVLELF